MLFHWGKYVEVFFLLKAGSTLSSFSSYAVSLAILAQWASYSEHPLVFKMSMLSQSDQFPFSYNCKSNPIMYTKNCPWTSCYVEDPSFNHRWHFFTYQDFSVSKFHKYNLFTGFVFQNWKSLSRLMGTSCTNVIQLHAK